MPEPQISAIAVEKAYRKGDHQIPVLHGVDIAVRKGEFLSIVGQSGSGKSTLLHLIGLLDSPDVGEVQPHAAERMGVLAREVADRAAAGQWEKDEKRQ